MTPFIWFLFYVVGYFFSLGAMIRVWDLKWADFFIEPGITVITFILLIWPFWWIMYIPYRLGLWLFK